MAWIRWAASRQPWKGGAWLVGVAERVVAGLRSIRQPRVAVVVSAWSIAIWCLAVGTNYWVARALDVGLGIGEAALLLVVLQVGVAPPSTPGKLGVFHSLVVVTLDGLGIDRSLALLYAVVLYFVVYLPQMIPGVFLAGSSLSARLWELHRRWRA